MKRILGSIMTLILALGVSAQIAAGAAAYQKPGVTRENFLKIKDGMSYAQVVEIIGKEGEVLSETYLAGTSTVMYGWKPSNADRQPRGANMNVLFQNDKVVSKAQAGLK